MRLVLAAVPVAGVAVAQEPADSAEKKAYDHFVRLHARVRTDRTDPVRPVLVVDLNGAKFAAADLKPLADLPKLKELVLGGNAQMTDAWLKPVVGRGSLAELVLSYTAVTDAGLKELAGMKGLSKLVLDSTAVTDAGVKELEKLKTLRLLYLGDTKVSATAVDALKAANPQVKVFR